MDYRHTQTSYTAWIILLVALVAVIIAVTAGADESSGLRIFIAVQLLVLAVASVIFSRLTVTVHADTAETVFGWGWPRHVVQLGDVTEIRQVHIKWYFGWASARFPAAGCTTCGASTRWSSSCNRARSSGSEPTSPPICWEP